MNTTIEKFASEVSALHEDDFGDFMRLVNLYLNELKDEMDRLPYTDIHSKISEMQGYIQFNPSWEIEPTQTHTLQDAKVLDELLAAHQQDWES